MQNNVPSYLCAVDRNPGEFCAGVMQVVHAGVAEVLQLNPAECMVLCLGVKKEKKPTHLHCLPPAVLAATAALELHVWRRSDAWLQPLSRAGRPGCRAFGHSRMGREPGILLVN